MFTHASGFGPSSELPDGWLEACQDPTEYPTFEATLRLETDGHLDAYASFSTGFHKEELVHKAQEFKIHLGSLLMGVDAFDREFVWQRLWFAQRFYYTGRAFLDMVDRMLWDLASRHAAQPIYRLLGACREKVPAYKNYGGTTIDDMIIRYQVTLMVNKKSRAA